MKIKFVIGLLSLFGLFGNIQGQIDYLDITYRWTERHTSIGGPGPVIAYKLNSMPLAYNGNMYYEVLHTLTPENNNWQGSLNYIRTDPPYIYLLREQKEYLIYDFTLDVNDTFNLNNGINSRLIVVTDIDSVAMLNGEIRKRFTIQNCSSNKFTCFWFEGLCSSYSVLPGPPPCAADAGSELLCLYRQDTLLYQNNPMDTCWTIPVLTEILVADQISVFPNPVSSTVTIISKDHLLQKATVIDVLGNVILTVNTSPIDIGFLPPGYYFLHIELENKQVVMKRFVKQ